MPQFIFDNPVDEDRNIVQWGTPGLTVILDTLGIMNQLVPATALPYYNAKVITGHDTSFQVFASQSDGVTPFSLVGIPINFYGKVNQSDTILLFSKSLSGNPGDIIVPSPTNGLITVWLRATDYAAAMVGTTIFLYVDVINSVGNPVNISKWTVTITN